MLGWPRQRARREARVGARPRLGAFVGRGVAPFAEVAGGGGGGRRVALRARRRAGAGALDSVRPARASRDGRRRAPLAASLGGPLRLVELHARQRRRRRLLLQPVSLGRQHCPAATASRRGQPGRRPRHRPPCPAAAPSVGARLHRPCGSRRAELVARVRRGEARGAAVAVRQRGRAEDGASLLLDGRAAARGPGGQWERGGALGRKGGRRRRQVGA
mmetsp:Transcript_34462/g.110714  ORF Transcript_34462/g.110714 Transcript_34462/m.110714 type:complete len:217 (+) Transcript_34462:284-934(+)